MERSLSFVFSVVVVLGGTISMGAQGPSAEPPFPRSVDRLRIAHFAFSEDIDRFYNTEEPRLTALCYGRSDFLACRMANLRPFDKVLAVVRSGPSDQARVVGELHAVLCFHPQYDLGYRIDFVPAEKPQARRVWLESVGDWGYGILIPGVRAVGRRIRLFDSALPRQSWIDGASPAFQGGVSGITGQLISLPSMPARGADGVRRRIPAGSYKIMRIRGGVVTLRGEIDTDMPCGEDVKPPKTMPPSMLIDAAELFSARGDPLFEITYSRGC